jgi:GxxExxY protein
MKLHDPDGADDPVTARILSTFFRVYNTLGWGFLEVVYRRSMAHALRQAGALVVEEAPQSVYFDGQHVGEYRADLLVDGSVVVELKAVSQLAPEHRAQVVNFLRASRVERGLLLNFGPKPEIKRVVFDNDRKRARDPQFP